jgi:hypothetical protein
MAFRLQDRGWEKQELVLTVAQIPEWNSPLTMILACIF